ncbi:hypothetical protein OF83DRAFT_739987 [Amylostereum chailletii]|nr:hypothetical protein OF83DRAFT_739987 [Amylostereum chailletii]
MENWNPLNPDGNRRRSRSCAPQLHIPLGPPVCYSYVLPSVCCSFPPFAMGGPSAPLFQVFNLILRTSLAQVCPSPSFFFHRQPPLQVLSTPHAPTLQVRKRLCECAPTVKVGSLRIPHRPDASLVVRVDIAEPSHHSVLLYHCAYGCVNVIPGPFLDKAAYKIPRCRARGRRNIFRVISVRIHVRGRLSWYGFLCLQPPEIPQAMCSAANRGEHSNIHDWTVHRYCVMSEG